MSGQLLKHKGYTIVDYTILFPYVCLKSSIVTSFKYL